MSRDRSRFSQSSRCRSKKKLTLKNINSGDFIHIFLSGWPVIGMQDGSGRSTRRGDILEVEYKSPKMDGKKRKGDEGD